MLNSDVDRAFIASPAPLGEGTAAMVQQFCFLALWLIDGKLQVLSLSN